MNERVKAIIYAIASSLWTFQTKPKTQQAILVCFGTFGKIEN